MPLITWDDSYSVKVREIDSQHKKLVKLINHLDESIKAGKGKEIIDSVLNELVEYTAFHFSFEESLFAKYSYPETNSHAKQHNSLIEQIKVFMRGYQSGKVIIPEDLSDTLMQWLAHHVNGEDKKYSSFFNERGLH